MPNHSTTRGQQSQRPMSFWTQSQNFFDRIVAKNTDWFYEKEEKWKKKLSDLAQGLGQSAPPEWMPLPDEGEISGRAADSRVEVPKQTSERVTRERVPQIITKDWTKANRDRANEVTLQLEPHAMYTLNYSEHGR